MLHLLRPVYSCLLELVCQAFHAGVRAAQVCLVFYVSHAIPPPALPSVILLAIHLPMMAARLASAVVCVFGLMTVLVRSVVMSGTLGPRHACGSLVLFLDEGLCMWLMVGLPVRCAVGMTASFGTIMLLVL